MPTQPHYRHLGTRWVSSHVMGRVRAARAAMAMLCGTRIQWRSSGQPHGYGLAWDQRPQDTPRSRYDILRIVAGEIVGLVQQKWYRSSQASRRPIVVQFSCAVTQPFWLWMMLTRAVRASPSQKLLRSLYGVLKRMLGPSAPRWYKEQFWFTVAHRYSCSILTWTERTRIAVKLQMSRLAN